MYCSVILKSRAISLVLVFFLPKNSKALCCDAFIETVLLLTMRTYIC
jgi:hypothetical protein